MASPKLRLYAHRGACVKAPENSLAAFRIALEDGANALETDLHCSRDGHFVLLHDPDGRRVAGDSGAVSALSLAQIKRWRLRPPPGCALPPEACTVATLHELLEAFPTVPLSIDLKPNDLRLVPRLLELVDDAGASERVTVSSFHDRVVERVRRLGYPGRTALTRLEVAWLRLGPGRLAPLLVRGQAAQIPLSAAGLRLDGARFVARCRRLGLRVDFWVVNEPVTAQRLLERGATGVMSDDPGRVAAVFALGEGRG